MTKLNKGFMKQKEINKVEIRNLQKEDYDQLASSFTRVYADGSDVFWTPEQIDKLIRIFPEGQIVTVVDDKIVGGPLTIIVNYNDVKNDHLCPSHRKRNIRHSHTEGKYPVWYRSVHTPRLSGSTSRPTYVRISQRVV